MCVKRIKTLKVKKKFYETVEKPAVIYGSEDDPNVGRQIRKKNDSRRNKKVRLKVE